jgi:anaerobic selenocysteine-containing dehydrogenase
MTVTRTAPWSGPGCHNACGLLVYTKDNRVIKVEGDPETPFNQGRLCARCLALPKVVHHPDRLTHPLKRVGERGEGKWKEISWDEAYGEIAEQVGRIQREHGSEAIMVLGGTGRNIWHLISKLCFSAFRSPNLGAGFLSGLACYGPKVAVSTMTTGFLPIPDCSQMFADRYDNPQWKRPECLIIWGNNAVATHADNVRGDWFLECIKRGYKLVVVDPRLTWLASRAKIWLQVRPGTDAAVALGMLNVIIEEKLYDQSFVDNWTDGFDRLRERVKEYPPDKVAEISWVPKEKIVAAARLYATSKPAMIQWGVAVEQHKNGMSTLLALQDLWGITGNIIPLSDPNPFYNVPVDCWGVEDIPNELPQKRLGSTRYPITTVHVMHPDCSAEALVTDDPYPVKMVWMQSTNPIACMGMEPQKLYKGIKNVDFAVVVDLFMTPSAMAFADIVLPAASALERDGIRIENWGPMAKTWWGPVRAINKVVQVGEAKSDEQIVLEVGKRLNPDAFPWDTVEEMLDFLLRPSGVTFSELRERGIPHYPPFQYRKYEKRRDSGQKGFDTENGKFNLYIPPFEMFGMDPLPFYEEPLQSPVSTPELSEQYPLILTTGARPWTLFHSEHRQIPELREIQPDPTLDIHPDTARDLDISDGDWVWIENNYGKCRQKARFNATIHPNVVNASHAWWFPEKPGPEPSLFGVWESNINQLLPLGQCGPSGFCAPYRSNICRVYR